MLIERLISGDHLPERLLRFGTRRVVARRLRDEAARSLTERESFIASLSTGPLAGNAAAANQQHYEQPADFFALVLGRRLKYSASLWPDLGEKAGETIGLDDAEDHTLALYTQRARIAGGQRILDLGCGWGSLSLWLAESFPDAEVTALSNSRPQRDFITERALERELSNLTVVTIDAERFDPAAPFDRIVSVEMFEHLRNYELLFDRLRAWLAPDGLLFAHVFAHRSYAYPYEDDGETDWMARRFFTGGIMPSRALLPGFAVAASLEPREDWWENGGHYAATADAWLSNHKRNRDAILAILARESGPQLALTRYAEWKLFFVACSELFGYAGGREWGIAHYLFGHAASD